MVPYTSSFVLIVEMVVKTRSQRNKYYQAERAAAEGAAAEEEYNASGRKRTVKILTPSFRAANLRTYKVYNGVGAGAGSGAGSSANLRMVVPEPEATAADALMALASYDSDCSESLLSQQSYDGAGARDRARDKKNVNTVGHTCINPMHPITRYNYRVEVFNSSRTLHYKTAFILYNSANRLYYVYSIVSNCYPDSEEGGNGQGQGQGEEGLGDSMFATPRHTIQMKYTSYIHDDIVNYIMTVIVPSKEYDYFIRDDIIGVVSSNETSFKESVFSEDSSYYDVDSMIYDDSSPHTTDGFNAFQLIPSRNYWYDPLVQYSSNYTKETVYSILSIVSRS